MARALTNDVAAATLAEVRLADVTADNWRDVAALELEADQRDLVAGNLYSIAESKFDPLARPRAIYAGANLVGFLMYDADGEGGRRAVIYRFMIDRRCQGRGYGRAALQRALDEIRTLPGIATVSICYDPSNPAKRLYASVGFVEIGCDEDGEVIAEVPVGTLST
ncbi:GNAT family N-acetyltransferase [Rhodoplanes sp.]|uniref:GNAT family N-acetyltransferase n=1 Tax=Rhodoplanes sp. TaxID=1968906 RepID=UPI0025F2078F|nr:GNAT family N-acetyltransferase [Rhodoplanes sp.]